MTRKNSLLAAVLFGFVTVAGANAASVSLDELVAGGTLTSGDKTISNVTYTPVGDMPAATDVVVSTIFDGTNYGFRFNGGFFDFGGDDAASDAFIEFKVTVDDPGMEIIGVTLLGNPAVVGTGNGVAQITETFLPTVTDVQLDIHDFQPGSFVGFDSVTFDEGHSSLMVQKDLLLDADQGAVATLSFFDQYFIQQPVPEPASLGLLAIGFIGLLAQRQRRS